jgi:hypothetical protein
MKISNSICGWLKLGCPIRHEHGLTLSAWLWAGMVPTLITLLAGSWSPVVLAAENTDTTPDTEMQAPDLEFLEFLGQFETDDGEWIGPTILQAEEFDELLTVAESIEAQDKNSTSAGTDNQ